MSTAIGQARTALRSDTVRLSRTGTAVDLTDFMIPILYCRDTTEVLNEVIDDTCKRCGAEKDEGVNPSITFSGENIGGLVVPIGRE